MRIIQLDETQTDISTRAHFHPLAIRLYGQNGINAAGPTGSEVRQASPPPPKPLLSPFIPSSSSALHCHPSQAHTSASLQTQRQSTTNLTGLTEKTIPRKNSVKKDFSYLFYFFY